MSQGFLRVVRSWGFGLDKMLISTSRCQEIIDKAEAEAQVQAEV